MYTGITRGTFPVVRAERRPDLLRYAVELNGELVSGLVPGASVAVERFVRARDETPRPLSGGLPDGTTFEGVAELERGLLQRPELFAATLTEKLLTFALGRGIEPYDAPAVREIVRRAQDDDFRFSALILGIVNSTPLQMRKTP